MSIDLAVLLGLPALLNVVLHMVLKALVCGLFGARSGLVTDAILALPLVALMVFTLNTIASCKAEPGDCDGLAYGIVLLHEYWLLPGALVLLAVSTSSMMLLRRRA